MPLVSVTRLRIRRLTPAQIAILEKLMRRDREHLLRSDPAIPGIACVRLLKRDAQWVCAWGDRWTLSADRRRAEQAGTPLLIIGEFGDAQPGPWPWLEALASPIGLPPPPVAPR